ncbi:hypothetical protein [Mucilaginibacter agri]|uniref:Uncharacterized protein n=1 Tax=Mucilaginibacter agri TaxID=2695265 RepID=A0A966DTH4_9SPHI|nr:hypothetical protein [Mucilaginibacter agri]NCD69337.1 hypothetical protein [Mucilaginibacter agri]
MSTAKDPAPHGRKIKLSEARKMIADYKGKAQPHHLRSLTISADHLRKIIDQPGCEHVRFHVCLKDGAASAGIDNAHSLVAVGVDSQNKAMLQGEADSEVYEDFTHCPPTCNDGDSF